MPTLPSGMKLALLISHIMEPDLNWFRAPEGHFWYGIPDLKESPPPFDPADVWLQEYVTAPVPRTLDEVKPFVRVCIGLPDGMMYWRGETLVDFPRYGSLSADDLEEWQRWLATDRVTQYLESAITYCATQSEVNKGCAASAPASLRKKNQTSARDDAWVAAFKPINNPLAKRNS